MTTGPFELTSLSGAVFSDDRRHRYWLWRVWDRSHPLLVTCMFNPSTADAQKDDPTISRLCGFARRWGYGGVLVVNLHSLRSSDPRAVRDAGKASWGDAQPTAIGHALAIAADQGTPALVAWGTLPTLEETLPFIEAAGDDVDLICLGTTSDCSPKHPMARGRHRVPDDQQPTGWR